MQDGARWSKMGHGGSKQGDGHTSDKTQSPTRRSTLPTNSLPLVGVVTLLILSINIFSIPSLVSDLRRLMLMRGESHAYACA